MDFADVELLGFGEPTHGEPAFPRARDELFKRLVRLGFRSIAVEYDRVAALAVDDFVHGLSDEPPHGRERQLAEWMRAHNRSTDDRLTFHGFDVPVEMMHAESPGPYLRVLRDSLPEQTRPPGTDDLDRLVGDDRDWSDPRAQLDATHSVGRSPEAVRLRVLADDLLTALHTVDVDNWYRAYVHGVAALGLLRYHAVAADPAPPAVRASRMLAVRDALMARNLLDLRRHSSGPMMVAAHNRHLQRHPSRWNLAGMDLEWRSAGSIVSSLLGQRYAVIVGSLGSSAALGLAPPGSETFEGRLGAHAGHGPLFISATDGTTRTDVTPEQGYFPLDAETVEHADAIWHIDLFPAAAKELADRIRQLPGVESHQSGPGQGVPEVGWDDWFFFVGSERKHPFATIVGHDIPGFDEDSRLDRVGVYRLNLDVGRDEFRRLFGYGPEGFKDRRDGIDFARFDEPVPHPVYATQSWASVVNPGPRSADVVDRLLRHAHARGSRHGRSRSGA